MLQRHIGKQVPQAFMTPQIVWQGMAVLQVCGQKESRVVDSAMSHVVDSPSADVQRWLKTSSWTLHQSTRNGHSD